MLSGIEVIIVLIGVDVLLFSGDFFFDLGQEVVNRKEVYFFDLLGVLCRRK